MLIGNVQPRFTVGRTELLDTFTQRFRELRGIVQLGRQQHREPVAGNARCERTGRQSTPDQLAELPQHRVAHVHAEVVVDDVQLVGIDVQRGPVLGALCVDDDRAHALFERRPCVQTAERVVAALDECQQPCARESP